jgi:hypothetical protein
VFSSIEYPMPTFASHVLLKISSVYLLYYRFLLDSTELDEYETLITRAPVLIALRLVLKPQLTFPLSKFKYTFKAIFFWSSTLHRPNLSVLPAYSRTFSVHVIRLPCVNRF